jgi:hypothetical protein
MEIMIKDGYGPYGIAETNNPPEYVTINKKYLDELEAIAADVGRSYTEAPCKTSKIVLMAISRKTFDKAKAVSRQLHGPDIDSPGAW